MLRGRYRIIVTGLALTVGIVCAQQRTVGLLAWDPTQSWNGYTLFPGKHVGKTVLIDNNGYVVHSWNSAYEPGQSAYLLPNGNLLRCALLKSSFSIGGGEGGRFEMYSWEGAMLWGFDYASPTYMSHHDAKMLPSGNLLAMAVEKKTAQQCLQAGFDTTQLQDGYVSVEYIVEFKQNGPTGYTIVWEWHLWDHLIQDRDPARDNYGVVKNHPELNDVASTTGSKVPAFWNHGNSIDYNAKFDQICISIRGNSEFWIIDHSTTSAEAAGHTGGKSGKGGDILYRWGNPASYDCGKPGDRILYQQHDAQWIPEGCPGAGHIIIYNNGIDRFGVGNAGNYSSIEEMVLPCDTSGVFTPPAAGTAWGPATAYWTYTAPKPTDFYSAEISGIQRLPNGNTLVCEGLKGQFFELNTKKEIVWRYISPLVDQDTLSQGDDPAADIDPRGHQNNAVFKVHRYAPDYAGLTGRTLTPIAPLERNPLPDLVAAKNVRSASAATTPAIISGAGSLLRFRLPESAHSAKVTVFSAAGAVCARYSATGAWFAWNTAGLARGVYFVKVSAGAEEFNYRTIVSR
jgi:hypothetical protein